MTGQEVAFLILALIGGLAGLLVVTSRNVVHAALYLVVALSSVAGVYLLLAAPFVAFVQVIIYVGAIVVLILFGIMLTRAPVGRRVLRDHLVELGVGAGGRRGPDGGAASRLATPGLRFGSDGERLRTALTGLTG